MNYLRPRKEGPHGELGILARRKLRRRSSRRSMLRCAIRSAKIERATILRRAIRRAGIDAGAEMAARADGSRSRKLQGDRCRCGQDDALTIEIRRMTPAWLDFNLKALPLRGDLSLYVAWGQSSISSPSTATAPSAKVTTLASICATSDDHIVRERICDFSASDRAGKHSLRLRGPST